MQRPRPLLPLWTLAGLGLLAVACGPKPEAIGDLCKPKKGCPDDLVCAAASDGEDRCFAPPGGACDPMGEDFCLDDAVCQEDGLCATPPGGACDPMGEDFCGGDAICDEGTCRIPAGGACDPAGENYCVGEYVCGDVHDGSGAGICGIAEGGACDPSEPLCAGNMVCAELVEGGDACYPPVLVKGHVFDSLTSAAIGDALVLALDEQSTAVTDVAVTDEVGDYVLDLPVPRESGGAPIPDLRFTLRSSADGYQTFPGGLRTALPIASSEAVDLEEGWTIQTAITDVALIALPPDQQGLASVSGHVLADDRSSGVLVVAEGEGAGRSAVTDRSGAYTIFNVPAGAHTVKGYAAGLQLAPVDVAVSTAPLEDIDLSTSSAGLGSIAGNLNIVNAPGGATTSVVLVVESTFSDTFIRGEVPRGLRTPLSGPPDVAGAFMIADVPAGRYVVLAAFENDDLVRDPDPNIAGTQIVTVEMPSPGLDVTLADSFKITEALGVVGPGADDPELVSGAPTLRWLDDSSEDFYTVVVYNAYGDLVWCLSEQLPGCDGPNIPGVSGQDEVTVPYMGPLDPGMYYQFRATSWRAPGGNPGPIATTEDLRGVFYVGGG
ncbi:MAG: carboxypeptidase-like regulatory domain-containing protein [Nannocystaceae bacterium]